MLAAAHLAHSERFVHGAPHAPKLPTAVWIDKPVADLLGPIGSTHETTARRCLKLLTSSESTNMHRFAECMRDLVGEHYPDAERIRVVLDNLSTHSASALSQRFAPA